MTLKEIVTIVGGKVLSGSELLELDAYES